MIKKNITAPSLGNVSAEVSTFLKDHVADFTEKLRAFDREIDNTSNQINEEVWSRVSNAFLSSQDACRHFQWDYGADPNILEDAQTRFRLATDTWFQQSWIGCRARTKPSGFPGDYRMLIGLYDQQPLAIGLGAYLDLCISCLPLANAVRSRMQTLANWLVNEVSDRTGDVHILDIASGPCREFVDWTAAPTNGNLVVTCLDNDQNALDYVQEEVAPCAPGVSEFRTVRYNALRTKSAKTNISKFGAADILFSVGLCDYLTDKQLIGILSGWRESLADNGVLYVAFKDGDRYDKTPYQWHLDWHFYQRSQEHCLRLFELAGFDLDQMEITKDQTGIIMNFIYRPITSSKIRIDQGVTELKIDRHSMTDIPEKK